MKALHRLIIPCVGTLGLLAAGCGDNDTCGEGFAQEGGMCVPAASCGTGTTLDTNSGECVPDGSVVCTQGTVFDAETGTCLIDPNSCADGTVFVGGECIPEDENLEENADHVELPEPNDGINGIAGQFPAPAEGESTTFFGCIEPTEDVSGNGSEERDVDAWVVTTTGPTLIDVTADGIRGLSAAFQVVNGDVANSPALDSFNRIGINLTGDTSKRQVYLPVAGIYVMFMEDSRALFFGETAGGEDQCYFTTVTSTALPAAQALTAPQTRFNHSGDVVVFNYNAANEGDIVAVEPVTDSEQVNHAHIVERAGAFVRTADGGVETTVGGLAAANDEVVFIYDPIFNFATAPQLVAFNVNEIGGNALNIDGTVTTVTKKNGDVGNAFDDANYLFFEVVNAGAVVHFDLTSDTPVEWRVMKTDLFESAPLATIVDFFGPTDTFVDEYVRFLEPGRYYLQSFDPAGTSGDTYDLTATLTELMPSAVTYNMALADEELVLGGGGFHTVDAATPKWMKFNLTSTDMNDDVVIFGYPLSGEGFLRGDLRAFAVDAIPEDGTGGVGFISQGFNVDTFVQVFPLGTPNDPAVYEISVGDQTFTDLGAIDDANAVDEDDVAVVAGEANRFFATATTADELTTVLSSLEAGTDGVILQLGRDELDVDFADDAAAGGDETLAGSLINLAPETFFAISVLTDADDTIDLDITAVSPTPYNVAAGNLVFADVCNDVAAVSLFEDADDEDSGLRPLGFAFDHFGVAVTDYAVSSNGIVLFDNTPFLDFIVEEIPEQLFNDGLLAPFWADLAGVDGCVLEEADKVTIQWDGTFFGVQLERAQFQAVINDDGTVHFIYGNEHSIRGGETDTSIGLENFSGLFGRQVLFNQGGIDPGDSFVATPL